MYLEKKPKHFHQSLPSSSLSYLLNEKRRSVSSIEKRHGVQLVIIPNPTMDTPQYSVARRRPDDAVQEMSYNVPLIEQEKNITDSTVAAPVAKEQPALQSLIAPDQKKFAPAATVAKSVGLIEKVGKWFSEIFKSEEKDSNWPGEQLQSADQLEVIATASFATPQLIFKHSARCSISRFVLSDFMNHYTYASEEFGAHYIDLLNHRDISSAIADRFNVVHQSPQLIIIKDGKTIAHASHEGINELQLSKYL